MKVAFSSNEKQLETSLEGRFGRCSYFLVVDTETRDWDSLPNPAAQARGGAGTQAAQFLANQGVQAIISGGFGPNAYTTLDAAGINMYAVRGGQINALLEEFLADRLKRVSEATGPKRHRGGGRGFGRSR